MNNPARVQFSVRTLLFVTFVFALSAAILQLSTVAGCLAILPIAIAVNRALRIHLAASAGQHRLTITFLQSLALLVGLFVVSISTLAASTLAVALMSVTGLLRPIEQLVSALWQRLLRGRIALTLLFLGQLSATAINSILAWTCSMAFAMVTQLNRTNRSMATYWSHRPTSS